MRHAVHFVVAIVTVRVAVVVRCWGRVVGGVDVVVPLHLIFVHVKAICIRIRVRVPGIARDVVGSGGGVSPRLVGIATGVRLSQIGHAARVGVHVLSVAAAGPAPVGVVPGGAVLHAGLAGVGGAIIQDLGAAAALGWREHQGWNTSFRLSRDLGLRFQTAAALSEMLRCVLTPGMKVWGFLNENFIAAEEAEPLTSGGCC